MLNCSSATLSTKSYIPYGVISEQLSILNMLSNKIQASINKSLNNLIVLSNSSLMLICLLSVKFSFSCKNCVQYSSDLLFVLESCKQQYKLTMDTCISPCLWLLHETLWELRFIDDKDIHIQTSQLPAKIFDSSDFMGFLERSLWDDLVRDVVRSCIIP